MPSARLRITRPGVVQQLWHMHAADLGDKKQTIASPVGHKTHSRQGHCSAVPRPAGSSPLPELGFRLAFVLLPVNKTLSVSDSML